MTGADDPLSALARALTAGHKPTHWLTSHGSSLDRLWAACRDARTLLAIAARAASRPRLVLATCACAREALGAATQTDAMHHALRAAAAWADGQATLESLKEACRPLEAEVAEDSSDMAACVLHAAAAAYEPLVAPDVADGAARVLSRADAMSMNEALAVLASTVRTRVACPTLGDLLAGASRGPDRRRGSLAQPPSAKRR